MNHDLSSTLLKVALPVFAIVVALVVSRARGISATEDLRLTWPRPRVVLAWIAVWAAWCALGEVATRVLGLAQAQPWKEYAPLVVILRVTALGVLGPAAEEILMRGLVFFRLSRTRLGPAGAIVACAAIWSLLHLGYDAKTKGLIFADGIVLGLARHRSRSTYVPVVMHSLGNLFSIWQSLHA
ncbi:MAG: CPBP family intramembrane glutamic endopeptidase [bacterium]